MSHIIYEYPIIFSAGNRTCVCHHHQFRTAFILSRIAPKLLEKHTGKVYAVRFAAATVMFLAALGLSR